MSLLLAGLAMGFAAFGACDRLLMAVIAQRPALRRGGCPPGMNVFTWQKDGA